MFKCFVSSIIVIGFAVLNVQAEIPNDFNNIQLIERQLAAITSKDKGEGTDVNSLESSCLELLSKYNSREDKGLIYSKIALMYSGKGYTSANDARIAKTAEYCKKALDYPLDAVTACEMYGRWAGSLTVKYWKCTQEEFVKGRQDAIMPCLTGLKLALDNKAPKERQKLPVIQLFDHPGPTTDAVYQAMLR